MVDFYVRICQEPCVLKIYNTRPDSCYCLMGISKWPELLHVIAIDNKVTQQILQRLGLKLMSQKIIRQNQWSVVMSSIMEEGNGN